MLSPSRMAVGALFTLMGAACSLAYPTRESGAEASELPEGGSPASGSSGSSGSSPDGGPTAPAPPRSCAGLGRTCRRDDDCCRTAEVPAGTFNRSFDGISFTDARAPATVASFRLDVYEVTVGRFRAFVNAYAIPAAGTGKNPSDPLDTGWRPADYDAALPVDADALKRAVEQCGGPAVAAWTAAPDAADTRPMTCVSWFDAFAFCAWDGGRLPTEAEWNYAAAGGPQQRAYPWSAPGEASIDTSRAVHRASAVEPVGARAPAGNGAWGHADLAGNVAEWVLDSKAEYRTPCVDCAELTFPASEKRQRGGAYSDPPEELLVALRRSQDPRNRYPRVGVRCAR